MGLGKRGEVSKKIRAFSVTFVLREHEGMRRKSDLPWSKVNINNILAEFVEDCADTEVVLVDVVREPELE